MNINHFTVFIGCFDDDCEVRGWNLRETDFQKLVCEHEEADTRIPLSILECECGWCFVLSRDTDVFISLLAHYEMFAQKNKRVFMRGTNGWLNITAIAEALLAKGVRLKSLPLAYCICGCDQVSFLYSIGKITGWNTFLEYPVSVQYSSL